MKPQPDFTPDELATVKRWLKHQAQSSYARAPIAYQLNDNARAVLLYEESDTAHRWIRDIELDQMYQNRTVQS